MGQGEPAHSLGYFRRRQALLLDMLHSTPQLPRIPMRGLRYATGFWSSASTFQDKCVEAPMAEANSAKSFRPPLPHFCVSRHNWQALKATTQWINLAPRRVMPLDFR